MISSDNKGNASSVVFGIPLSFKLLITEALEHIIWCCAKDWKQAWIIVAFAAFLNGWKMTMICLTTLLNREESTQINMLLKYFCW